MADSPARVPEDADDPHIPVAATVVVLRDAPAGVELLMMERPDRGSFAGAWVFPGGKIEPVDASAPDEPESEVARRAGARETFEEVGLQLDPDAFATLSRWDPPPGAPLRIRTWFFAVVADAGELVLSEHEAVSAQWVRPEDVLARHARGELTLYPPTWVTLHSLTGRPDTAAALAAVRLRGVEYFDTVVRRADGGPLFLWAGDAEYAGAAEDAAAGQDAAAAEDAASSRHRLETASLPWRYTRTV